MRYKANKKPFRDSAKFIAIFLGVVTTASISIASFLPQEQVVPFVLASDKKKNDAIEVACDVFDPNSFSETIDMSDQGLMFYRLPQTRNAVEFFYEQETKNREVAHAILQYADKNDIPLSLAFALAYVESRYKSTATNYNTNNTVDRGIFQLNSNSFPHLTEAEFYDPYISARCGLSHLHFCLASNKNRIINAISAYNAGSTRITDNRTPYMTLTYASSITSYSKLLDRRFQDEVVKPSEQHLMGSAIAYNSYVKIY